MKTTHYFLESFFDKIQLIAVLPIVFVMGTVVNTVEFIVDLPKNIKRLHDRKKIKEGTWLKNKRDAVMEYERGFIQITKIEKSPGILKFWKSYKYQFKHLRPLAPDEVKHAYLGDYEVLHWFEIKKPSKIKRIIYE